MLSWQRLNSWFEWILWTCYSIYENNKWSLIHWGFIKNFTVRSIILTWRFEFAVWANWIVRGVIITWQDVCLRYNINLAARRSYFHLENWENHCHRFSINLIAGGMLEMWYSFSFRHLDFDEKAREKIIVIGVVFNLTMKWMLEMWYLT